MVFEIRKTESSNKTIRMKNDLIEKLENIASEKDISFNQLVVQCCEYAISNLKDNDSEKATDNTEKNK